MEMVIFCEDVKEYGKHRNALRDIVRAFYSLIWGHYSNPMKDKLGVALNYINIDREKDSAALLEGIKCISYKYNGHQNPYLALGRRTVEILLLLSEGE